MKINKILLSGSTTVLILSFLDRKDMYGAEIIKEIKEKSNNAFLFGESTLYPLLHSLEHKDYVESYVEYGMDPLKRKRKYYKITEYGKKVLSEKEEEWKLFSSTLNKLLWELG